MVTREQKALEREIEQQELEGWSFKPRHSFARDVAIGIVAIGILIGLGAVVLGAVVLYSAVAAYACWLVGV
jgi:hypothetical protein